MLKLQKCACHDYRGSVSVTFFAGLSRARVETNFTDEVWWDIVESRNHVLRMITTGSDVELRLTPHGDRGVVMQLYNGIHTRIRCPSTSVQWSAEPFIREINYYAAMRAAFEQDQTPETNTAPK